MPTQVDDLRPTLVSLFEDNWNPANVAGITPGVFTGWVNPDGEPHQITVHGLDEEPQGRTGFSGTSGSGLVSIVPGSVFVDSWARKVAGGVNWKRAVYLMKQEVERIVLANVRSVDGFQYIAVGSSQGLPPDLEQGTQFMHWSTEVRFSWIRTPT